jgi:hypothetical protein
MAQERSRLKIDLDAILPGDEFKVGNSSVTIRPLSIFQYKLIIGKIKALIEVLQEKGITGENYKETKNIMTIAEIVMSEFPDLLEEVSNIAVEDLNQLPLEIIIALIDKCLDVNLKAKESLLGNFKSLIGKARLLGMEVQTETPAPKVKKDLKA